MDPITNKHRVVSFYKLIVGQRKTELIPEFVREDYKQHNPMVKQGRAGITEMINYLKTLPPPPETTKSPIIRAIQEGDLVITHLDIVFMGQRKIVIDLFRLKDGMLAEHWDVMQDVPDQTGQVITATNGTTKIDETLSAKHSKHIVKCFYKSIISKEAITTPSKYIKPDYIEHDPEVILSGKSIEYYLKEDPERGIKIHRIISEGNFVVVQSEFKRAGKAFALYEILRIADNKIAERWSVEMLIPEDVVRAGGMF